MFSDSICVEVATSKFVNSFWEYIYGDAPEQVLFSYRPSFAILLLF